MTGVLGVIGILVALYLGGATWAVNRVLRGLNPDSTSTLRSAKVTGNLLTALRLHDVRLTRPTGEIPIRLDSLAVRYDPRQLLGKEILIGEVRLFGPSVVLPLPGSRKPKAQSPRSAGPRIHIQRISIARGSGQVRFTGSRAGEVLQLDSVQVQASEITTEGGIRIGLATVRLRFRSQGASPDWTTVKAKGSLQPGLVNLGQLSVRSPGSSISASGRVPIPGSRRRPPDLRKIGLHISARPLAYRDLGLLDRRLNRPGTVDLTLDANGQGQGATLRLSAGFSDGGTAAVEGFLSTLGASPAEYRGQVTLRQVDPSLLSLGPRRGDRVNGDLSLDLHGPSADQMDGRVRVRVSDSRYGSFRARWGTLKADFSRGRARIALDAKGAVAMAIRGWLRPFDSVPSYDLTARIGSAQPASTPGWLGRLIGSDGTRVLLHVAGDHFDPHRAELRATATLVPGASRGVIDSASVRARLTGGLVHLSGSAGAPGGVVDFGGQVTLGKDLRYRIHRGSIRGVDLAALLGDTTASALDATFSLQGQGTSLRSATARASVSVSSGSYGPHQLTGGRVDLSLRRAVAQVASRGILDGASLDLNASGQPFSPEPTLTIERVRFRHLDLARLAPGAGISTDLSGTGSLRSRGRRLERMWLTGHVALEHSRFQAESLETGNIDATLSRGDLDLRLQATGRAGRLALEGTARPFDSIPSYNLRQGNFHDLELGRLLKLEGLHTRLAGGLRLHGSGRQPERATLAGTLTLEPSVVNRAAIRTGRVQVGLAQGRLRLNGRIVGERDSVTIDGLAEPFTPQRRIRLESEIAVNDLASWLSRDTLDAGAAARIGVEGEWGSRETMRLRGAIQAAGHFDALTVDSLRAKLRLADGKLNLDTLSVGSNVADATGSGRIALFGPGAGPLSFRLVATLSDLAPLGAVLGVAGLALDSGRVTASLQGTRDRPRLKTDIQARNLVLGPRRARTVQASLEGELAADRSVVAGTGDLLLRQVSMPDSRIGRLRVRGSYGGQELALRGEADLDAFRRAWLAARVYPGTAERRIELDTIEVRNERERWQLSHPVRITYGDRLRLGDFILSSGGRRIAVDGVVDRRGEQRLGVRIDSMPVGWLTDLIGVGRLDGEINGSLDLTGPAADPRARGDLSIGLRSGKKVVANARGRLDWAGGRGLQLDLGLYHRKGDSLRIAGQVPWSLSLAPGDSSHRVVGRIPGGKLALDAAAADFPLDILEPLIDPATVKTIRGRLSVDAHARGSLEAPTLSGKLDLSEAKIQVPRLGAKYEKGLVHATLHGETIRLERARFEAGKGSFEAQGTIRLGQSAGTAMDLQATLQDFQLADGENLRSTVTGKVRLSGSPAAPLLAGAVDLRNLDFYLQAKDLAQSAEPVELTPADLSILEDRFGLAAARPLRSTQSRWALNLDVALAGNNWVRRRTSPAVAVELSGKLGIQKESGQEIKVFGAIQPLAGRSFVELLGRRFDVTSGEVGLNGPLSKARMTLNAEYQADSGSSTTPSGVVITTRLSVDTGLLAVTLGSRPKLSNADIRSYLATGRPAGTDPTTKSDETSPLTAGASLAVGAALGSVAGGAGRRLGFDVVQILQDRNGGQTLVAGKYVSPPLYLGFREPIVAPNDPTEPESAMGATEWELEYAAFERALLNLQGSGEEFRVFLRLRR